MSDEIRVNNRPAPQSPQPRMENSALTQDLRESGRSSGSKTPWIILGAIIVILIVLGVAFRDRMFGKNGKMAENGKPAASKSQPYQAVFLTNGQVYFGKVSGTPGDYLTLTDIWYLQVVQPQQPIQGQQPAAQPQQPQISLVKLGQELHGPVDEMHISKAQILFYEDLKEDGQVVKTIMEEKAKQK